MDPLSIIASSVAVAHLVHVSIKAAYAFRQAKPELIALYDEISDLLIVLHELETVLQQRALLLAHLPPIAGLTQAVVSVKGKLEQLQAQISKWNPQSPVRQPEEGLAHFRRLGIAHQAKRFKEEFRDLRERLSSFLTVVGLSSTSRIEINLRQILLLAEQADERDEAIKNLLQAQASSSNFDSMPQETRSDASSVQDKEPVPISGSDGSNETLQEVVLDVEKTRAFHHNGRILFDSKQLTAVSAVETRIQTPQFLQRILGGLFIGYSGLPVLTQPCDQQSCHLRAQPMSYITYFFPLWFLARMVSLIITTTPMAGPVVSLKTQRTIPGNADIFTYAKLGYVDKLQALFENGLASPHDVHYESGVTALHLAISHQRLDVCKYLLDMNADPFLEDRSRWTAADNAWDKILVGAFPAETQRALRLMFSETECIERRDFTILHKIVLGLVSGDLSRQLSISTADLNTVDNNGRVPVSLAAERGDLATVTTLLQYNANVNIGSSSGSTPLHFASCAQDPSCIMPLINAGALVDAHTNWKPTPLIYAAAYTRDARHAEALLDAGAHIDWRDLDGITALGWTAIAGNVPVAEVLVRRGADATNVDHNKDTIVTLCVTSNRVEILRLLVGRTLVSDDVNVSTRATKNVLLVAAEHATLDTINALCQLSLEDVDIEATGSDGRTWREILDARADYDETIAQALDRLVGRFRSTNIYLSQDDDDDGGIEVRFEDALEHQNS